MITRDYILERVSYNQHTGSFTWTDRPASHFLTDRALSCYISRNLGKRADHDRGDGYRVLSLTCQETRKTIQILAHDAAWIVTYGEIPAGYCIDHRDIRSKSNAESNLRLATQRQNTRNRKGNKFSGSIFKGVFFSDGRWMAQICRMRSDKSLEKFTKRRKSEIDCAIAYDEMCAFMHSQFARLNLPCMRISDITYIEVTPNFKKIG